jgi:hypothetical protein
VPRFVCQSAACRREITLQPGNRTGRIANPRCTCGSEMKKVYTKPAIRELSKAEALLLPGDGGPQSIHILGAVP